MQGIPAVYALRDGKVVDGFVGAQPEAGVREFVARLLPTEEEDAVGAAARRRATRRRSARSSTPSPATRTRSCASPSCWWAGATTPSTAEALALLERIPESAETRRVAALARVGADVADDEVTRRARRPARPGEGRRRRPPALPRPARGARARTTPAPRRTASPSPAGSSSRSLRPSRPPAAAALPPPPTAPSRLEEPCPTPRPVRRADDALVRPAPPPLLARAGRASWPTPPAPPRPASPPGRVLRRGRRGASGSGSRGPPSLPPEVSLPFASTTALGARPPPRTSAPPEELVVHVAGAVRPARGAPPAAGRPRGRRDRRGRRAGADGRRGPASTWPPPWPTASASTCPRSARRCPPPVGAGGAGEGEAATAGPVDLNTADEAALDALPGIGPATATAIIEHRAEIGRLHVGRPAARRAGHRRGQARAAPARSSRCEAGVPDRWAVALALAVAWRARCVRARCRCAAAALARRSPGSSRDGRCSCASAPRSLPARWPRPRAGRARRASSRGPVAGEVTLLTDPEADGGRRRGRGPPRRSARAQLQASGAAAAGLARPAGRGAPGGAGRRWRPLTPRAPWSRSRHLAGRLTVHRWSPGPPPGLPARAANGYRRTLDRAPSALGERRARLFAGLVMGDDRDQPADLADDFRGRRPHPPPRRVRAERRVRARPGRPARPSAAALAPPRRDPRGDRRRSPSSRASSRRSRRAAAMAALAVVDHHRRAAAARVCASSRSAVTGAAARRPAARAVARVPALRRRGDRDRRAGAAPIAGALPGPAVAGRAARRDARRPARRGPAAARRVRVRSRRVACPANLLAVPAAGLVMVWGMTAGLLAGLARRRRSPTLLHLPDAGPARWIEAVAAPCGRAPLGRARTGGGASPWRWPSGR